MPVEGDVEVTISRWFILIQMCLCMFVCAFAMQSIPPVLPLILGEFHLSHHQGGMLMSMFALPAIVISLPVGLIGDRYGIKLVGAAGLVFATIGIILVLSADAFIGLVIGRIITGIGGIALLVIAPHGVAARFQAKEVGLAMGILNTVGPIGIFVTFNALPAMATQWGWRTAFLGLVFLALIILTTLLFFYRPLPQESKRPNPVKTTFTGSLKGSHALWLVVLAWAFFNASFVSFFSFTPDFLVDNGFDLASAGFYTSMVVLGALIFSFVSGYFADKIKNKALLTIAGGLGLAVSLYLMPGHLGLLTVLMIFIGVSSGFIAPSIYAIAAESVSLDRLGFAFGLLSMFSNIGVFIGPQLVGFGRDITGSYKVSFFIMALFALLIALTAAMTIRKKLNDQV